MWIQFNVINDQFNMINDQFNVINDQSKVMKWWWQSNQISFQQTNPITTWKEARQSAQLNEFSMKQLCMFRVFIQPLLCACINCNTIGLYYISFHYSQTQSQSLSQSLSPHSKTFFSLIFYFNRKSAFMRLCYSWFYAIVDLML